MATFDTGTNIKITPRTPVNIAKLAGLLEGEGCFSAGTTRYYSNKKVWAAIPRIVVTMTDKDVMDWVASVFDKNSRIDKLLPSGKTAYSTSVGGTDAIGWMMTLYPLMGQRRRAKIKECIEAWKLARGNKWALGLAPVKAGESRG